MRMKILELERKKLAMNTVYSLNTLYTVHTPEPPYCISTFTSLAPLLVTVPPANSNITRLPCRVCALSVEILSIGCMLGILKSKQSQGFVWKGDTFVQCCQNTCEAFNMK